MGKQEATPTRRYRRWLYATAVSLFLLLIVGGTVRITGSGMGCPDWPLCFGRAIPPVSESQLPPDYQEKYKDHGYADMRFNAIRTWIEYVNRLVSVVIGFIVIGLIVAAWKIKDTYPAGLWFGTTVLVLILFEAWLGAKVVETNLQSSKITIHFFTALGILFIVQYAINHLRRLPSLPGSRLLALGSLALMGLMLAQFYLGTAVRSGIDAIAQPGSGVGRESWIDYSGEQLPVHRYVSIALGAAAVVWLVGVLKTRKTASDVRLAAVVFAFLTLLQVLTGLLLNHRGFPAAAQFSHLVLALGMFAALSHTLSYYALSTGRASTLAHPSA